jgi:hypothetical protein
MSEYSITQAMKKTFYTVLVLICIGLLGCSAVGKVIPVEKRVQLLETTATQEVFKADGLTVLYSYIVKDGIMTLNCSAAVRFKMESFGVRLLFLDVQGTVLEQKLVYSSGDRSTEKTLDVPPGTVDISFNYSGQPYRGHQ